MQGVSDNKSLIRSVLKTGGLDHACLDRPGRAGSATQRTPPRTRHLGRFAPRLPAQPLLMLQKVIAAQSTDLAVRSTDFTKHSKLGEWQLPFATSVLGMRERT